MSVRNIIYWSPDFDPKLSGYTVTGGSGGTVPSNIFADSNNYADQATADLISYGVSAVSGAFGNSDDLTPSTNIGSIRRFSTEASLCIVSGQMVNVAGMGARASIKFFVHHNDVPFLLDGAGGFLVADEVVIYPNAAGEWSIPLLVGALVTIHAPAAHVQYKFTVPDQPTAVLKDLDLLPVELFRNN